MTFSIQTLDGITYDFRKIGIRPLRLEIDSLSSQNTIETIDGQDGHIDIETIYEGRTLRASFLLESKDIFEYTSKRNEIYKLFSGKNYFYLIESRLPNRRWKVRTASRFLPEKVNRSTATFDIELISTSPFAQSPGTTLDMHGADYYYSIGDGKLDEGDPVIQYSFSENNFAVFNDSDVTVDPRNMDLKIILKGTLNNPIIRNLTTGDEWSWNGSAPLSDEIVLDGIRSLKNGQSIFGQTNRQLITLEPGWNYFEIFGSSDFTIDFDFRFYYL